MQDDQVTELTFQFQDQDEIENDHTVNAALMEMFENISLIESDPVSQQAQLWLVDTMLELEGRTSPTFNLRSIKAKLSYLVRYVNQHIDRSLDQKDQIHQLLYLFYDRLGFHCDPNHYFYADNMRLSYVLTEKKGMPVALGAILLYLAAKCDLPLFPTNFPLQLILRASVGNESAFIDPWEGSYTSIEMLNKILQGHLGIGVTLEHDDLILCDLGLLKLRLSQIYKAALVRERRFYEALRVMDYCIEQFPSNPYEYYDRASLYVEIGYAKLARESFTQYVLKKNNELDVDAETLRLKIEALEQDVLVLQ